MMVCVHDRHVILNDLIISIFSPNFSYTGAPLCAKHVGQNVQFPTHWGHLLPVCRGINQWFHQHPRVCPCACVEGPLHTFLKKMLLSHDTEPAVFGREEITLVVATVNHFDDKVENKHISSL